MDQAVLRLVKTGDAAAGARAGQGQPGAGRHPGRAPAQDLLEDLRRLFRGHGARPAAARSLRQARRLRACCCSTPRWPRATLGVSDRLAQDLRVLLLAGGAGAAPPMRPSLAGGAPGLGPGAIHAGRLPDRRSSAASIPCCWRRRASASSSAKETWSALSGGDANKIKGVADQFHLVSDSLVKLHPPSAPLAQALSQRDRGRGAIGARARRRTGDGSRDRRAVPGSGVRGPGSGRRATGRAHRAPGRAAGHGAPGRPARAAGALDGGAVPPRQRPPDHGQRGRRTARHAGRAGKAAGPVLPQSRRTRRRCATRRATCRRCAACCRCWASTRRRRPCCACARRVEEIIVTEIDEEQARAAGTFDKLGNNLGALGFLIDMLNYQPALAKKLFVYDDSTGELQAADGPHRAHRGRSAAAGCQRAVAGSACRGQRRGAGASRENLTAQLDAMAAHAVLAEQTGIAHAAREAAAAVSAQDTGAAAAALSNLAAAVKPPAPVVAPAAERARRRRRRPARHLPGRSARSGAERPGRHRGAGGRTRATCPS